MTTALIYLACSTLALGIIAGVFRVEDARGGHLVILGGVRRFFNKIISAVAERLSKADTYFGRGFPRLMLHYLAHGVLYRLLAFVGRVEKRVAHLLRRNKQVAKDIRTTKEKTHLDKIADHQKKVALTDAQKKKMRSHD